MGIRWEGEGSGKFLFTGVLGNFQFAVRRPYAMPPDSDPASSGLDESPISNQDARARARMLAQELIDYLDTNPDA